MSAGTPDNTRAPVGTAATRPATGSRCAHGYPALPSAFCTSDSSIDRTSSERMITMSSPAKATAASVS
ncbi:hypothetical protein GCM10020360_22370 [Nonlabens tegetincola]